MNPKFPLFLLGAVVLAAAVTGCVSIRTIDEEELPAAWKKAISGTRVRPPLGRFHAAGRVISGSPEPVEGRLERVFFPGVFRRPERPESIEFARAADGNYTARAWRAGAVVGEVTFPGRVDPATGWLELERIPVKNTQKFAKVAEWQSARVGFGSDGALYAWTSSTAAGMVLFLPAFGRGTSWGRWESVSP
jgi:hypothetical protein